MNQPLTALVSLLPANLQDKAKTLVAVLGVVVGVVVQTWTGAPKWVDTAVAVLTALGVYAVPNVKAAPAPDILGKA